MEGLKLIWILFKACIEVADAFLIAIINNIPGLIEAYKAISSLKPLNFACNLLGICPIFVIALIFITKKLINTKN